MLQKEILITKLQIFRPRKNFWHGVWTLWSDRKNLELLSNLHKIYFLVSSFCQLLRIFSTRLFLFFNFWCFEKVHFVCDVSSTRRLSFQRMKKFEWHNPCIHSCHSKTPLQATKTFFNNFWRKVTKMKKN